MEKVKGIATDIRMTSDVSGGARDTSVKTTHICIFSLNGKRVQLSFGSPIHLDEGDTVALVGHSRGGVFNAIGYKNVSKGIDGSPGSWPMMGFGVLFIAFSLYILINVLNSLTRSQSMLPFVFVCSGFSLGGLFIVLKGMKLRRAGIELNEFASRIRTF